MEEMKQYLSGQEEIDAVLSPTADEIPDVFIHKPKKLVRICLVKNISTPTQQMGGILVYCLSVCSTFL